MNASITIFGIQLFHIYIPNHIPDRTPNMIKYPPNTGNDQQIGGKMQCNLNFFGCLNDSLYIQVGIHNKLFRAIETCMCTFYILKISIPKHSWEHPKPWRLSWNPEGCGTGGRYEVHAGRGGGRPPKTLGSSPWIPKDGAKAVCRCWTRWFWEGGGGAGRVGESLELMVLFRNTCSAPAWNNGGTFWLIFIN